MHEISMRISFRNTTPTEAIKKYAHDKLVQGLVKFIHHDIDSHLILAVEKNEHSAELTFHSDGKDFSAKTVSNDLYKSLDLLVDNISTQLRKHKEKITNHHKS